MVRWNTSGKAAPAPKIQTDALPCVHSLSSSPNTRVVHSVMHRDIHGFSKAGLRRFALQVSRLFHGVINRFSTVYPPGCQPAACRHCERSEAIHSFFLSFLLLSCCSMDCFALLAMTILGCLKFDPSAHPKPCVVPASEPGPNPRKWGYAKIVEQRLSKQAARRMGPCFRRDDDERIRIRHCDARRWPGTRRLDDSPKQRPVIPDDHARGVVAGGAGDAAAGMGAGAAVVETFQGAAIIGMAEHRPRRE